ncbi:DUF6114 domain-containing protein [Actinoplanes sp. NPDC024001]|uniref:DUF6114 domain-containing protein n=1 Tax=Actinoplanes sp. NPDC024001 TaxID=3154598 RepID=UPI0033E27398
MATESFWVRFGRWRRGRPFWGGLLLVLSGLEMFLSANMQLDNIEIHIGPQGFLSYLLPTIMLVCGVLAWVSPAQRLFYGIVGTLTALYSFVGLNLGGWFAGMILGIVGGALAIAWGPAAAPPIDDAGPPAGESGPDRVDEPTAEIRPAVSDSTIVPGLDPDPKRPLHRKAFMLILPLAVAGGVAVANVPAADAAECPEGLPSRTVSATPATSKAKPKPRRSSATPSAPVSATPAPSTSPSAQSGTGNPILDGIGEGIGDVVEGIGDLLGIGGDNNATPTPSPTSAAPAAPSVQPPSVRPSSVRPSSARPAKPSRSAEEIPCLGARQEGLVAEADGLPRVGLKPGLMKVGSLTMYNSTYEGVTELPTRQGSIRALRFVMDKAVNKPFSLQIGTTLIKSNELITDGNVEFYSPRFTGKLFGLIPVTFTPEQPPPLTLPVLWFTDVTIDLAYVQCDVLTADPIDITAS